jgi:hypothetical protein
MGGCLNASSVTLAEDYAQYESIVAQYPYEETGSINMFNGQKKYDLYSGYSYTPSVYQAILVGSDLNFSLLRLGNEYQTLLAASMNFFYTYANSYLSLAINNDKVPQELKTDLYYALQDLDKKTQTVYTTKISLETLCGDSFEQTDAIITNALKKYLSNYQDLIGSAIEMNLIFEEICLKYINPSEVITTIHSGGIPELLLSAQLHIADYLYNRYMVFEEDVTTQFRTDNLFSKLSQIMLWQDIGVENYELIIGNATAVMYYRQAVNVNKHFNEEFSNLYNSVSVLDHEIPEEDSALYSYYSYMLNYKTTMMTYSDIMLSLIVQATQATPSE